MSAESALVRLIQSSDPRAIALIGGWGRGKTYFWRHLIQNTTQQARSKYSYVSLFGVNSADDLRLAIFQREIDAGPSSEEETTWAKFTKNLPWRKAADAVTQLDNPWIGNLNALYRTISFSRIRSRLICFDDLERRGKDLALEEVLGLITFLCEERECSVVLIVNDSTMDSIADWNKYREKVFNAEVTYRPSTETCTDIIFGSDPDNEWFRGARHVLVQLDVSNMRIMQRIRDSLIPLEERYADASNATKHRIGATLALYSYCHNASGEGAPPVELALKHPYHRIARVARNEDDRSEDEKNWDAILSKVDFYPDELDLTVVAYLRNGYPDNEAFDGQVARLEAAYQSGSAEESFSAAWRAYHESFDDNSQEIIERFRAAYPAAAPSMHAMNANSTISLMRRMGEDELADRFIEDWIASRRGERRQELSLRAAEVFGAITDTAFKDALNKAEQEESTTPDLAEAMTALANGNGALNQSLETISLAKVDAVVQWLEANPGRPSRNLITNSMQYRGADHVAIAQKLIRAALKQLGEKSAINAIRVDGILKAIDGN